MLLPAGAALLSACAPLDWHKAGATATARDRDLGECTTVARSEALRRAPMQQASAPRVIIDREGRAVAVPAPRDDNERFLVEQELQRDCMRKRGYELQPRTTPTH